jgi:hypothetical protein
MIKNSYSGMSNNFPVEWKWNCVLWLWGPPPLGGEVSVQILGPWPGSPVTMVVLFLPREATQERFQFSVFLSSLVPRMDRQVNRSRDPASCGAAIQGFQRGSKACGSACWGWGSRDRSLLGVSELAFSLCEAGTTGRRRILRSSRMWELLPYLRKQLLPLV